MFHSHIFVAKLIHDSDYSLFRIQRTEKLSRQHSIFVHSERAQSCRLSILSGTLLASCVSVCAFVAACIWICSTVLWWAWLSDTLTSWAYVRVYVRRFASIHPYREGIHRTCTPSLALHTPHTYIIFTPDHTSFSALWYSISIIFSFS